MEYRFHCWDIPAKKSVYGESPVFVFDPDDRSNALPRDPDYETARERWEYCPQPLKEMFIRAFSGGVRDPDRRVTEGEWQALFSLLKDSIVACQVCRAENFLDRDKEDQQCWHCGEKLVSCPEILIRRQGPEIRVALSIGTMIRRRHIASFSPQDDGSEIIGTVVAHPGIPGAAGIRNNSSVIWQCTFPGGSTTGVPQGRAVPLNPGTEIRIEGATLTITAPRD
jgi:hypothetical protein